MEKAGEGITTEDLRLDIKHAKDFICFDNFIKKSKRAKEALKDEKS